MRQVLDPPHLPAVHRARQHPTVRTGLLLYGTLDDDLTALDVVLLLLRDRHDPEPVQAEQQRRSVSRARGSQCG